MAKKDLIFKELNEKQEEALLYFDSPLRIIAGAGSGKTRVLTRKIAYLINEIGVPTNKILAVTFTNKAANEMTDRVKRYSNLKSSDKLNIYTYHSLCARILREEYKYANLDKNFVIVDETDKKSILSKILKNIEIDPEEVNLKKIIKLFSWAKINGLSSETLKEKLIAKDEYNEAIIDIYNTYNQTLQRQKSLDFDDLILKTYDLFLNNQEVIMKWNSRYSYILVDEFQDTSYAQYQIVKFLVSENTHITIVGDPDQTIYSWRQADVNLILNFDKDFPNTKTIVLNTNYRSTKTILDAANKLIKKNTNRYVKDLITNNENGSPIEFKHAFNVQSEARWVVQKINELKKNKVQLKNIGIFYRSSWYSQSFEEELINEGINYKIFNDQKFFQRKEIKDVLAFLRVIYDGADVALYRVINVPNRKIGVVTLDKIEKYFKNSNKSLYENLTEKYKELPIAKDAIISIVSFLNLIRKYNKALETNKISLVLEGFLKEVGYNDYIKTDSNLRGTGIENVKELISSIKEWENKNPEKNISDYLEKVALISAGDEYEAANNYVSLMTVHAAKGLEFDYVFMVGMSDQFFPHKRSLTSPSESKSQLEEERRLAYVGVTRAKKRLFISDSRGFYYDDKKDVPRKTSRFVWEMGIDKNKYIINIGLNESEEQVLSTNDKKIIPGDTISHTTYGEGVVLQVEGNNIVVKFIQDVKPKTLDKNHRSIKLITSD